MGLFDRFKKKSEDREMQEVFNQLIRSQIDARSGAVDADEIPKAFGPFGFCKTNPIPTNGISGSNAYLARLRTSDGKQVSAERVGSTAARDVTSGMIDVYKICVSGTVKATIYLCPYHKRNSGKAPEGFLLT